MYRYYSFKPQFEAFIFPYLPTIILQILEMHWRAQRESTYNRSHRNGRQEPLPATHQKGYKLHILTRSIERAKKQLPIPAEFFEWKDTSQLPPEEAFREVSSVINLAGENLLSKKWSDDQKKKIYDSRIVTTKSLMAGLNKFATLPLEATISISGFNVYEESSEPITERSPTAENFLAKVCEDWEDEVQKFQGIKRTVIPRTPMVLAHDCEFVKKAFLLADFGLATYFGNGEQSTPWIHVEDLCEIIHI